MKLNKKGFTLIELLAVIVILAVIALIATPVIMNVITDTQKGADARSVETYAKEFESQYYQWMVKNPGKTASASDITTIKGNVKTNGDAVTCTGTPTFDTNGKLSISGCTVGGRTTSFSYTSDGGAKEA